MVRAGIVAAGLLLLSCSLPIVQEQARITPDWSAGLAGSANVGTWTSARRPDGSYITDYTVAGLVAGYVRRGLNERWELSAQAGGGGGFWASNDWKKEPQATYLGTPTLLDARVGLKYLLARNFAVKAQAGYPMVANLTLLWDATDSITAALWVEPLPALSTGGGVSFTHPLFPGLTGHASLLVGLTRRYGSTSIVVPTFAVGYGLEVPFGQAAEQPVRSGR